MAKTINRPEDRATIILGAAVGTYVAEVNKFKDAAVLRILKLHEAGIDLTEELIRCAVSEIETEHSYDVADQYEMRAIREEQIGVDVGISFDAFELGANYQRQSRDEVAGATTVRLHGTLRWNVTAAELVELYKASNSDTTVFIKALENAYISKYKIIPVPDTEDAA